MRIKSITIENLFGNNQRYHLELLTPNGVTIVHAQNGMGKTTILSMIPAILNIDVAYLLSIPFKSACIILENETIICVAKISDSINKKTMNNVGDGSFFEYMDYEALEKINYRVENGIKYSIIQPHGKKLDCIVCLHSKYSNQMNRILAYAEAFGETKTQIRRGYTFLHFDNKEFRSVFDNLTRDISVNFIKTDRLWISESEVKRDKGRGLVTDQKEQESEAKVEAITECAMDLLERIYAAKREKEDVSEALDRSFPKRLIELYKSKERADVHVVRNHLRELERIREELENIGLVGEENERVTFSFDEWLPASAQPVLEIYIEDSKKKLQVYDKIKKQINLLLKAINVSNAFINKKLEIVTSGPDYAMRFVSIDGREIPLEKLSSGEKHAVIMFYNLIFKSKEGALVMIDEPEISLHISWQQHFITSLLEICKENGLNAVVATHSPDIVNDHWDLLVNLDGTSINDDPDEEE